jgi:hypothetical protein
MWNKLYEHIRSRLISRCESLRVVIAHVFGRINKLQRGNSQNFNIQFGGSKVEKEFSEKRF